jgi:hypothetical protein
MKKFLILIPILLLVLLAAPAFAQEQPDILEIENSMIMGYDLGADAVAQTHRFGINFNLTDSLDAGFMAQQAGTVYTAGQFLLLRYTLMEGLGFNLMYGSGAGMGVSYDLLRNDVQYISTVLRINMEYLLQDIVNDPIDEGIFGVSLSLGFGI